jgi:pentapeptide MXKDX repeat protein
MSVDEMYVFEMSVDEMSVDEMFVHEMSVDEMSVDEMSVDQMSVDQMSVDQMSLHEKMSLHDTLNFKLIKSLPSYFFFINLWKLIFYICALVGQFVKMSLYDTSFEEKSSQ